MSKKSSYIHNKNVKIRTGRKGTFNEYIYKKSQTQRIEEATLILEKKLLDIKNKNKKLKNKINLGRAYLEEIAKLVSENIISQRDAIIMFDARKLGNYKTYKENVNIDVTEYSDYIKEKYGISEINPKNIIDKKYFKENVEPFRKKREKYIKSGLYEELRWEIYKNNYIKAIEKTGDIENLEKVKKRVNRLKREQRAEFIKRAPQINSYYHPSENIEEITNDYNENILDVIYSLDKKHNKER